MSHMFFSSNLFKENTIRKFNKGKKIPLFYIYFFILVICIILYGVFPSTFNNRKLLKFCPSTIFPLKPNIPFRYFEEK